MCINKNSDKLPWYEALSAKLEYNPNDGSFVYNDNYNSVARKGKLAGSVNSNGYLQIGTRVKGIRKNLYGHRVAWFITYGNLPNLIDHINNNPIDNRIENLRDSTNMQNQYNAGISSRNTSGFKGVYWNKGSKKWQARINVFGETVNLGFFKDIERAVNAYQTKAKELHGEFYNNRI